MRRKATRHRTADPRPLLSTATPPPEPDQLLTLEQAAALTGLQLCTWRKWVTQRRVPHVKLGARSVRVLKRDVAEMIAAGMRPMLPMVRPLP